MDSFCLRVISAMVSLVFAVSVTTAEQDLIRANPERMEQRIVALSQFGANPEGGVSRIAFSDADIAARDWLQSEMRDLGLEVSVDAAGNVLGKRAGSDPSLPVILFGSHIDSVPGGGNYDGQVGVVAALEVIELMNEHGIETRHPLEVVSFTDEEGGLTGSRGMIGPLGDSPLDVMRLKGRRMQRVCRARCFWPGSLSSYRLLQPTKNT